MIRVRLLLKPFGVSVKTVISHIYCLSVCLSVYLYRDQDNAIIRPLPKVKRLISDNTCLPHIVQVLSLL